MLRPKTAVAQPYCGLRLSPCHTQASDGFQRCTCPQWGQRTGIVTRGRVSNLTVSVSRPVCTGFPLTGQLVRIAGTVSYNARRNPRLITSGASCLRGHRQYTVHTPAMTRLAAIQHKRQNSTVCIRPPGLLRFCDSGLQTSMRVKRARMRSLHREM